MNTEAAAYEARVAEETAYLGGPDAFRQAALENLRLKTVIKESHGSDVVALAFHPHPSLRTLLATAGGDQATVYDDAYLGAHVSAVVQWTNEPTPFCLGGELCSLCWLPRSHRSRPPGECPPRPGTLHMHPDGDALLLAGSRAGEVALLSVAEGRVMGVLRAHEGSAVAELAALRLGGRSLLASRSEEGQVRLWDLESGRLLDACHEPAAASMVGGDFF
ncbi:hypothetical protein H632_c3188p0 [Helicosporidium sp. ATCC 50920]|nr:hypothetical protein H632_c3188p0 [Helicosporidium sp. ATCC 50920]|eukprot:KDD72563.1 hypothetical protein H632_c3188p0 [Helicosporidium sp. ATCC 50920]